MKHTKRPPIVLCPEQISLLDLSIGSQILIEITNPIGSVRAIQIGDVAGYERIPKKEFGAIVISTDGYTLKLDSADEEIPNAYEYLQERSNEGHSIRFAFPDDESTWWVWQTQPWQKGRKGLTIAFNGAGG